MTIGCIVGVHATHGYLLGPEPGTALLLLLLALKPFEARGQRDFLLMLFLCYILVLLQFLHSQSLLAAGYMTLVILITTAAMLGLTHPASQTDPRFRIRQAGILIAQALPVMLILFVLFPRLPGSLWGIFQRSDIGLTGLSETMSPGDVSQLLQSSEVAFRVAFDDQAPPVSRMYWRALVLWEMDGRTWRAGSLERDSLVWTVSAMRTPIAYVLTMEPHGQRWLPVLEMPLEIPPNAAPAADMRIQSPEPIRQRSQFRMLSALDFQTPALSLEEQRRALLLPREGNARSRALARSWAEEAQETTDVVARALHLFRGDSFSYTLRPPLLGQEAVDDFLFRTRSGYCEHYASAFTFLMRAAGVPARVVLGYQGGERNPLGEYYVVRQYHAHAWSEVWLAEQGWTRVDPTSVLAPERIDVGAGALVPNIDVPRFFSNREMNWVITAWRGLTQGWDAANSLWNQWVLDFGFERQLRFLERLGLGAASRVERFGYLILAVSLSFLGAALVYGLALLHARPRSDILNRHYARFCKRLARIGIVRETNEGPLDFAKRAAQLRPDLAKTIMTVSNAYMQLRYGPGNGSQQAVSLSQLVRRFRPKPL